MTLWRGFIGFDVKVDGRITNQILRLLAWTTLWFALVTRGTFDLDFAEEQNALSQSTRFFGAQARSILNLDFAVDPAYLPGECFLRGGKCYGYFGLTPSILRIPLVFFPDDAIHRYSALFIAIALAITSISMIGIFDKLKSTQGIPISVLDRSISILVLTVLSPLLILARVSVYHEAIAWCIAFAVTSMFFFVSWWYEAKPTYFAMLAVAFVLSVGANPSSIGLLPIYIVGILIKKSHRLTTAVTLIGLLGTGAFFISAGVFFAKFQQFVPDPLLHEAIPEDPLWNKVMKANGNKQTSLRFLPSQIISIFRADSLQVSMTYPWVKPSIPEIRSFYFAWPISKGEMVIQRPLSLIHFALVPLFVCVRHAAIRVAKKGVGLPDVSAEVKLLLAGSILIQILPLSQVAVTSRYFAYLYVPMSLLIVISRRGVGLTRSTNPIERLVIPILVTLSALIYLSIYKSHTIWL